MKKNNFVRGSGPLDNFIAVLRHSLAMRKLKEAGPIDTCLDIGSGAYPAFLIELDALNKYGLEKGISPEQLEVAKANNISLVDHDLESQDPLAFEDNFFDVVTMIAVIEHIKPSNTGHLLFHVHRILKPGGIFFLTTPAAWTDGLLRAMASLGIIAKEEIDDHKDTFTRKKITCLLHQADFRADHIKSGTFECFMNLWACAKK